MQNTRAFRPRFERLEARDVPTFYGNQLFPADNPWNQKITDAPVAANSAAIIGKIDGRRTGAAPYLHADFGNPRTDGALYGIPVNVVDNTVPKVTVNIPSFGYADESDLVKVPIPANAVVEGDTPSGPAPASARGDSHLLVYDKTANVLYELYQAARPAETSFPYGGTKPAGSWGAYQISYWDLNTNSFRTVGATSADAAGLPILPGLARPDEANPASKGGQGVITHALRMTVQQTLNTFVYPASHEASSLTATDLPRMGERFRLKGSFVIPSTWSPEAKAVAQAMKDYGLIVADNGSDLFFTGTASDQWDGAAVRQVQSIGTGSFEVVDLTPVVTGLSTTSGPAGTVVTVTGKNFGGAAGQLRVLFGGVAASSVTVVSDTEVRATAPAGTVGATVDVQVRSGATKTNTNNQSVFWGYGTSAAVAAARFTTTAAANTAPTMTAVADRTVPLNGTTGAIAFTVADAETAAGSLSVTATSSDTALIPAAGLVLGGSGGSRTITVAPAAARSGVATVTLTVTDAGGLTATRSFTVSVTPSVYVGVDAATKGNWVGKYGSAGYALAAGATSLPAGAAVAPARHRPWTW
ncbi:MAG: IPT/TIG domain-containing protein, partial [Gemmataceae bacterium]|nr:IPT/TIG domain-containing protein [Gemmataceae bacterium]